MKNIKKFLEFNGKAIWFLAKDGQYWVALKPICNALGVDYNRQFQNLKDHPAFGQLFAIQQMVGADNRVRKMVSLPEQFVYGWIFQIRSESPDLVSYQLECCNILYKHFHGMIGGRAEVLMHRAEIAVTREQLKAELMADDRFKKFIELEKLDKSLGKELKEKDRLLVDEQLALFAS